MKKFTIVATEVVERTYEVVALNIEEALDHLNDDHLVKYKDVEWSVDSHTSVDCCECGNTDIDWSGYCQQCRYDMDDRELTIARDIERQVSERREI